MPIYEYLCAKCEHEFEREQRITEDPVKTCPKCRSRRVKRLISQTSFVLKGSGWYADGYGNGKGKKDADASGNDAGASDASSDSSAKSDSDGGKSGKSNKSEGKSDSKTRKPAKGKGSKKSGKAAA